jgi:hypothetical protein
MDKIAIVVAKNSICSNVAKKINMCRKPGLKRLLTISSGFRTNFGGVVVQGFCPYPSHNHKLNK